MSYHKRIIVTDYETGGLDPTTDAVVEIAMVVLDFETLEIVDKFECLFKPYGLDYKQSAMNIHGITMEMIEKEGLDFNAAFEQILEFISKQKVGSTKPIFAGHNFKDCDMGFTHQLFDIADVKIERYVNLNSIIDTMELSRWRFIDSAKHSLGVACSNAGTVLKEAHRAMPDTIATAKLVASMLKNLRGVGGVKKDNKKRVKFEYTYKTK